MKGWKEESSGASPRSGGSRQRTDSETEVAGWNPILL